MRWIVSSIVLLLSSACGPLLRSQESGEAGLEAGLDRAVGEFLVRHEVPGAAVGIVRDGELIFARGYGVRSLERREPVQAGTLFQIGSVTKTFSATLLMKLRDEGVVALDAPVSRYLPDDVDVPAWGDADPVVPTLHQLATHQAGFSPNPPNRRNRPNSPSVMEPYSVAELYQGLGRTALAFEPGSSWQYSNFGVGLLGHALERAAGRPYEQLMREELLEPLGTGDTRVTLTAADESRIASHYWPDRERVERGRWVFGEVWAFGGLTSTVSDLARFALLHLGAEPGGEGVVKGDSLLEMREVVVRFGPHEGEGAATGWFFQDHPEAGRIYEHGGEVDGHSSMLSLAPDVGVAIVVLANVGGHTADALHDEVVRVVVERLL